jgi:DNA-binding Lrp family transcriptional regulator
LADQITAYQAYRNRVVAGSIPALGTIFNQMFKAFYYHPLVLSDDSWSNLDKIDQKIIEILNQNARTPSKEIASELRKAGEDVSDRTIRKRIERLEKSGVIKGYKAVLTDVSESNEYEAAFLKLKPTKSLETIKDSIRDFVKKVPNYLFVANLDGDWSMLVVMKVEQEQKEPSLKIVEKFSDDIIDYRISDFDVRDVNLLNMSLLLL